MKNSLYVWNKNKRILSPNNFGIAGIYFFLGVADEIYTVNFRKMKAKALKT